MATKKRLIDLDAYEDFKTECLMSTTPGLHSFDAGFDEGMERAAEWLDAQPDVDAVEVVRCKNCAYGKENLICTNPHCTKSFCGCPVSPEHYCSFGERRTDA